MTQQYRAPEPQGDDWKSWARRMMLYLGQTRSPLVQQTGGESAAEDGVLMWDRTNEYPVVSKNGEWRQVVIGRWPLRWHYQHRSDGGINKYCICADVY